MSDFAGTEYEFAAGSLFGLRGWDMDESGRLHGVTHREVWRPGENRSACKGTKTIPCPGPTDLTVPAMGESLAERAVAPKKHLGRKKKRGYVSDPLADWERDLLYGAPRQHPCGADLTCDGYKHTVSTGHHFDPACNCGFWAYDEAGFKPHGSVVGVIEAFGKTTIGTKGFRAEKARIVGLCRNGSDGKALSRSVQARLSELYPDALFCDDMDQLVSVFDGVLRSWAEVDEGFWLKPVPQVKEDSWSGYLNSMYKTYFRPSGYLSGGIV